MPLRFDYENPEEMLQAYISLYLEEEVKTEGLIRRYDAFTRFLHVMSFAHGSLLNITNIARECAVKRTTVNDWIGILHDLLICYQIPIFTKRAQRSLSAHPKFYFFDAGVFRALRQKSIGDSSTELDGLALEGLVIQHLMAWRDYTSSPHEISFWRTRSGVEVDFIVYGNFGLWAIEVKNSTTIRPDDLRSLTTFKDDYPEATPILLYRGKERLMKNNILCIPIETFLRTLQPNKAITA